ncbi:hypothetical protein EIP91_002528 [Steccherinum ochraceum]|uniref:DUF7702 domain-containing protein n=1 Tax=Steccherinum ochraceum TaxID=92696 RepID=A0A4R0RBW4_9APHY|nr:hypothetical protein EIP91_002528 [Steccherinum ochraceum]
MGINARGGVALAQAIIYIPILCMSAILVARHGFKRRAGWVFLLILSLVRIVGGGIHVASELQSDPNKTLVTIFTILEGVGLSPLMLATLGFLSTVGQGLTDSRRLFQGLHVLGILSSVALILTVVGGINLGDAKTQDDVDSATKYRHIGGILFLVLFVLVTLLHGYFWSLKNQILVHRRTLLAGISTVLPFLFIRTMYGVLSAFSPASVPGTTSSHNSLSKFSSSTGSWQIYLVVSCLPELVTVLIYLVVGTRVPLEKDFSQTDMRGSVEEGSRGAQNPQVPAAVYYHLKPSWSR